MREIYVETEELKRNRKQLEELIQNLNKDTKEIQKLREEGLEKAEIVRKGSYREKWERENQNLQEAMDHLAYLCRMEEYAVNVYETVEGQILDLIEEI